MKAIKRGECSNCGYETELVVWDGAGGKDGDFCALCSQTLLSHATIFPDHVSDPKLYKSLGYIANMILDEVRKGRGIE